MTDLTTLYVPHPERWWIASRDDLAWLSDPDVDDGHMRHPDRDERQWTPIAGIVQNVARAVASGAHQNDEDDSSVALVTADVAGLAPADRKIVTSWFRATSEAPAGDPWDDSLMNGRHRLWNVWRAVPDALLPIYSDTLAGLDDVPLMGERYATVLAQSVVDGLHQMSTGPANRSPRYVDELRRVAREAGHDVDGLPRLDVDRAQGLDLEATRPSWWSRLTGRR